MNNITGLTHLILMNNINRNLRKSEKSESEESAEKHCNNALFYCKTPDGEVLSAYLDDNKGMLIQKKLDAYNNGPYEVNSIKDVPEEFYNHVYYSYLQPSDSKIVFCSEYTTGPGRMFLDVEDDTFFYFICTKEIADAIIEIHKAKGGPGSG